MPTEILRRLLMIITCAASIGLGFAIPALPANETAPTGNGAGQIITYDGKQISEREAKGIAAFDLGVDQWEKKHDLKSAKVSFQHCTELYPQFAKGYLNLALVLVRLGDFRSALPQAKKCVELDPGFAGGWHTVGVCSQMCGQPREAVEAYKKYVSLDPHGALAASARNQINSLGKQVQDMSASTIGEQQDSADDYLAIAVRGGCFRWAAGVMPVPVFIGSGAGVPGFRPEFPTILRKAFGDWQEASKNRIRFTFVPNPSTAKIVCHWTNSRAKLISPTEGGQALVLPSEEGIDNVKIDILTIDLKGKIGISNTAIHTVALHEIGHAIGLTEHSPTLGDAMFATIAIDSTAETLLTDRDRKTVMALYGPEGDALVGKAHEWNSIFSQATTEKNAGRYEQAIGLFQQSLQIAKTDRADVLDHLSSSLTAIASTFMLMGKPDMAEPVLQDDLANTIKRAASGPIAVATAHNNLGRCYNAQHKLNEARSEFGQALAIREKLNDVKSDAYATTLMNLGNLYADQGKQEEADATFKKLLAMLDKGMLTRPRATDVLESYATLLKLNKHDAEAKQIEFRLKSLQTKN